MNLIFSMLLFTAAASEPNDQRFSWAFSDAQFIPRVGIEYSNPVAMDNDADHRVYPISIHSESLPLLSFILESFIACDGVIREEEFSHVSDTRAAEAVEISESGISVVQDEYVFETITCLAGE